MKKLLAIVLAVAMIASAMVFTGCSGSKNGKGSSDAKLKILDTEYVQEDYAICFAKGSDLKDKVNTSLKKLIADGTVKKIIDKYISADEKAGEDVTIPESDGKNGTIKMATNAYFPPYEYYDGDTIVGIDVDIAKAIANDLGMKLEVVDIEFDSIIAGVQTGKYDMGMAGMTVTDERKESVDFSDSYATGIQSIIVKEDSDIKSFDDIAKGEYKVGVQLSTTGDLYATDDLEGTKSTVVEYQTGNDAVAALVAGKVDAVIIDNEPAKAYVAANNG